MVLTFVVLGLVATSCASADNESAGRDPIRVQALSVDGERLVVDDLGDTDTVLWFWAPW